jgi:hypothetical protein
MYCDEVCPWRLCLAKSSPTLFQRISRAPPDSPLEKGRSPPRPLRPLRSGGTVSALRLVTCWSSDALRLPSSGRTGRQPAAESSCSLRFSCAFLLPWPEFPETPGTEVCHRTEFRSISQTQTAVRWEHHACDDMRIRMVGSEMTFQYAQEVEPVHK